MPRRLLSSLGIVVLAIALIHPGCKKVSLDEGPAPSGSSADASAQPAQATEDEEDKPPEDSVAVGPEEVASPQPEPEGEGEGEGEGEVEGEGESESGEPSAAGPAIEEITRQDAEFRLGTVDDIQRVRLFADGFNQLRPEKRALAYHLGQALLAGRNITYDQVHAGGLEIRRLVEAVLNNLAGRDLEVEGALQAYLQELGVHTGCYDQLTLQKLVPSFTFARFESAAQNAYAGGADLDLARNEALEDKLARLRPLMFDPDHARRLLPADLAPGDDVLAGARLNIYGELKLRDLKGFTERYPLNSRLVRIDTGLVEQIYRTGDKRQKIAPGRYAPELTRVVKRLHGAMTTADRDERRMLSALIEYFRTADPDAMHSALGAMHSGPRTLEVCLGFLDTELDPRQVKGMFAGLLGYRNAPASSRLDSLVRRVQRFEDAMPWPEEQRRRWTEGPRAVAIDLLLASGRLGPRLRLGYRLPDGGERGAGKVLVMANAIETYRRARLLPLVQEFVEPEHRAAVLERLEEIAFVHAALREVLGPFLGQLHPDARADLGSALPVLLALRAELTALWLLPHEALSELRLVTGPGSVEGAYRVVTTAALVDEALADDELVAPEARARRVWLRHALETARTLELGEQDGKTWLRLKSVEELRTGLGKLLERTERILARADRAGAMKLLARYSARSEWKELKALAERARAAGLQRHLAVVYPRLAAVKDEDGRVADALVTVDESLEQQLLRFAKQ
ncbi:MAG TPA: hypothetical protein PK668_06075 [Myxococcota bacterium]|nr:hypothetical protein [Myxococcota bacterium]HRY92591.1 hypothetical protein [Myxococcota bacterium]HSA23773.1 hypothetical protein [Myxococcota bacterium]